MRVKVFLVGMLVVVSSLSGCFIEGGEGGSLVFDGTVAASDGTFTMNGALKFEGDIPPQDEYENIFVELYTKDGSLIYKERLGSIRNRSDELNVSISLSREPYYVIFDSPDIWDGKTQIYYYYRSPDGYKGYQAKGITEREELPITPDG